MNPPSSDHGLLGSAHCPKNMYPICSLLLLQTGTISQAQGELGRRDPIRDAYAEPKEGQRASGQICWEALGSQNERCEDWHWDTRNGCNRAQEHQSNQACQEQSRWAFSSEGLCMLMSLS